MHPLRESRLLVNQAWVGGAWITADDRSIVAIKNPASGEIVGAVPNLGASETRRAIEAAGEALLAWRQTTAQERASILQRWARLVVQHQEDLAQIMTSEQGKPLAESRGEIVYAASYLEWFGEEAKRVYGDTIPAKQSDRRILVLKEPIGVCAAITPWNFPAAMIARKVAPALAAGCTIVIKPSPQTPFSALALGVLAEEAGLPPGVVSILTGDAQKIGAEFTANPTVRKLSFTGSTAVGRTLMAQCAPTVKRLSLELGGNAPFIIFDDADLDAALQGLLQSKFRNSGQTCVCANRVLVQAGVYEAFAQKLVAAVSQLTLGNGLDAGVQQGPLINEAAVDKVEALIADAVAQGAVILAGGKRHALGGTFFAPTVIGGATASMRLAREEIFGPVAPLFTFSTDAEAVALANATESGLAGYFYSRDLRRVWRTADALECGMVGVNTGLISTETAPFGGIKQSGIGREGSHYGIDDYLQLKYVCVAGI